MAVRVLHVAQPTTGGVAHYVAPLVAHQVHNGFEVAVACPQDGFLHTAISAAGADHRLWPSQRSPGFSVGPEALRLKSILASFAPDVVHLHSSKAGLVGRLHAQFVDRRRRPVIFQPHGWSWLATGGAVSKASAGWERMGARMCDRVVCVSEAERQLGVSAGLKAPWQVVRTGVDLGRFNPPGQAPQSHRAELRDELGVGAGPLAVCIGRLSEAKGQDQLAGVWPLVRHRVPDARLALVGDGELRAAVEAVAGDGVMLVGASSRVEDWYAAADVVVVPSRWDALSLSLVEAAASGCSVVATDAPGAREVLGDSELGAVVGLHDMPAMAAAIAERLADPGLAAREGAALGREAAIRFDRNRTYAEIEELMRAVITERATRR